MSEPSNDNATFTTDQVRDVAMRCLVGDADAQLLRTKGGRAVYRACDHTGRTVIVKVLPMPPFPRKLRQAVRVRRMVHEARLTGLLVAHDVRVPRILGYATLPAQSCGPAYAKVVEDLGPGEDGMAYAKRCIGESDTVRLLDFEQQVIDITARMIELAIFDTDHGIGNFHVTADGRVCRLDLDDARQAWAPALATRLYARMVGRLVATYAFTVQPDITRANDFNHRLSQRLRFAPRVQRKAQAYIRRQLEQQRKRCGIDTHVDLPVTSTG